MGTGPDITHEGKVGELLNNGIYHGVYMSEHDDKKGRVIVQKLFCCQNCSSVRCS